MMPNYDYSKDLTSDNKNGLVYVIDDDADVRESIKWLLESTNYRVEDYESAETFIAQFNESVPSVILCDLRMPGMDGFEVLRSVKKSNPQVQVIILTGHGGDAEEQTAYRMGAYNFLKKPMDIDELLNSIRMAYRDKVENAMVAVSLAEGGDFDSAQDVLNEKDLLAEHKL